VTAGGYVYMAVTFQFLQRIRCMPRSFTEILHPDATKAPSSPAAVVICREWYECHGASLYSYLRFHLASADQAEDLTAEVFLRVLRHIRNFDATLGTPKAWLFRIAQNVLRDHQRQARRRVMLPLGSLRDLEYEAPSPEERLLWEEEVSRLLAALAELSPQDREIIGLCYASDLSVTEAGEFLGLAGSTVRMRLWRALRRLRSALA
jgi:RNA polymerase sigma-70 factor (ECF subfamily)